MSALVLQAVIFLSLPAVAMVLRAIDRRRKRLDEEVMVALWWFDAIDRAPSIFPPMWGRRIDRARGDR